MTMNEQERLAASRDYTRVERAIQYIDSHYREQPTLDQISSQTGLSPHHFHRLFTRWAGVSPKQFLRFLTVEHAKALLEDAYTVLDATYEVGLSGPGRLHDLFVTYEAITPGEYKRLGRELEMRFGFHPTPLGEALLCATGRGISALTFLNGGGGGRASTLEEAKSAWPLSRFVEDTKRTGRLIDCAFGRKSRLEVQPLLLKGTNFQIKVWSALLRIPPGRVVSYSDVAAAIGRPTAAKAVGQALSRNPIAYLVPCHRVIRKTGALNGYRWGKVRRKAMLGWEAASHPSNPGSRVEIRDNGRPILD